MSEWEKDKEFKPEQPRAMAVKKYNNLLTSGRWFNKDTKDAQILALVSSRRLKEIIWEIQHIQQGVN